MNNMSFEGDSEAMMNQITKEHFLSYFFTHFSDDLVVH